MTEELELCYICDEPTGKAGPGEDSIYRCGDEVGPLCEECNAKLDTETFNDHGINPDAYHDLLAACKRLLSDVGRWLTGVPAGPEESKSIYEQMKAAVERAEGRPT